MRSLAVPTSAWRAMVGKTVGPITLVVGGGRDSYDAGASVDVTVTGDTAIAHTQEKWTVSYFNKANNALITRQSYSLSETYHFVKQNGTWYINKLDIPDTTPTPGTNG